MPTREMVVASLPSRVAETWPDFCLLGDATEQIMQTASDLMCQQATWSNYKQRNTIKYLAIETAGGALVYISPGFPGRINDVQHIITCLHLDKPYPDYINDDEV